MVENALHEVLARWETFYVITGSAAAALTGLQFVVTTLINDSQPAETRTGDDASATLGAFGTPTVVHFSAALLLSAMMSAPWHSLGPLRATVLAAGVAGLVYGIVILLRARRLTAYRPVLEDWVWHVGLPLVVYGGLIAAAAWLPRDAADALFITGTMTLLLLFIGIHNAWDTVAYLTVQRVQRGGGVQAPRDASAGARRAEPSAHRSRRKRR